MIAADRPVQRSDAARLLHVDADGGIREIPRSAFVDLLQRGDLLVANDAAVLPASLQGIHLRTGEPIEVRLAARPSLAPDAVVRFTVVVFGAGDYRIRTEDRAAPPALLAGDRIRLGPLTATIERMLGHPRLADVRFAGAPAQIWRGMALHGRPIQYAHLSQTLELWDVWTAFAGPPVAYEPPSAGFALDWRMIDRLKAKGVEFATLTHAAGISSTGDPALDQRLPFDEPYRIAATTADAIARARREQRRIIAIGTTVVRALEHSAARFGEVLAGDGVADQRIGATTRLQVVDAILSGTHEPGASHYELLRAFTPLQTLRRADYALNARDFRTHEFGESVLIERANSRYSATTPAPLATKKIPEMQPLAGAAAARILRGFSRVQLSHVVQESHRLSPAGRLVDCSK